MPRTQSALALCLALLLAVTVRGQGPHPLGHEGTRQHQAPLTRPDVAHLPAEGVNQASYSQAPLPQARSQPPALDSQPAAPALPLAAPQRKTGAALPLAPRGQSPSGEAPGAGSALLTTLGSLALVLCLFFAAAWIMRRGTPQGLSVLPGEVVEILGRAPLPGRHQMHLVRCGQKLLLVAVSTAGADTLTEITDPLEVDRLCGLCRESHPHSATAAFRNILNQFGSDTAAEGDSASTARKRISRQTRLASATEDNDA